MKGPTMPISIVPPSSKGPNLAQDPIGQHIAQRGARCYTVIAGNVVISYPADERDFFWLLKRAEVAALQYYGERMRKIIDTPPPGLKLS